MSATSTRTHVRIGFANPFLRCDLCSAPVTGWHDEVRCGCSGGWWNVPCGHAAGVTSVCPSWSPVDGCCCADHLDYVPHASCTYLVDGVACALDAEHPGRHRCPVAKRDGENR